MNLIKFLCLDALLLTVVLVIMNFGFKKNDNSKSEISIDENNQYSNKNNSIELPSVKELLEQEKISRKKGSSIVFDSLIGNWQFQSVWNSGDNNNSIASSLLKIFSATLELRKSQTNNEQPNFSICNSIQFGAMKLEFIGYGYLKGLQPLLPFYFEKIELKIGSLTIFSRKLDIPEPSQRPFFALIGMGENSDWLSARGRGGGLALWIKGKE